LSALFLIKINLFSHRQIAGLSTSVRLNHSNVSNDKGSSAQASSGFFLHLFFDPFYTSSQSLHTALSTYQRIAMMVYIALAA
jgi:hypothetical protein